MIEKITLLKDIKHRTINRLRSCKNSLNIRFPKLQKLKQDIFELKEGMPEVLSYTPPIIDGNYYTGVHDKRLAYFSAEYRAYNFEGYEKYPNKYVCIDSKGDRRLKPHVYLKYAEVKPEYARQGVFSNAVKKLIELVKSDDECEGRIILDARKVESPTITKIPSPSLAHWKNGFRFINKEDNATMERVLKGELPPEKAPEGTMYYSEA